MKYPKNAVSTCLPGFRALLRPDAPRRNPQQPPAALGRLDPRARIAAALGETWSGTGEAVKMAPRMGYRLMMIDVYFDVDLQSRYQFIWVYRRITLH